MGVLILGGTTAAGKSDLAVELAEQWDAALVSADAMTVYRKMDIGTAKPPREVLDRIPHACIDVADPGDDYSVADFVAAFEKVQRSNERVLVVGGTPFYLAALIRPIAAMPAADPATRKALQDLPDPHARLMEVDPQSAARLHRNDRMRVIRALEVHALSGKTMTELHQAGGRTAPVEATTVWMDPGDLKERIEARLSCMVEQGYVGEVEGLLASGFGADIRPMHSFAYRHIVEHVQGGIDLDEAIGRTGRDTWQFARKQRTWARGLGWTAVAPEAVRDAARLAFAGE